MRRVAAPVSVFISKKCEGQVKECVRGLLTFFAPPHLACVLFFVSSGYMVTDRSSKERREQNMGKKGQSTQTLTKRRRSRRRPSALPSNKKRENEEAHQHTSTQHPLQRIIKKSHATESESSRRSCRRNGLSFQTLLRFAFLVFSHATRLLSLFFLSRSSPSGELHRMFNATACTRMCSSEGMSKMGLPGLASLLIFVFSQ